MLSLLSITFFTSVKLKNNTIYLQYNGIEFD